ncbi:importin-11-like isoform X1 [Amphibalanus amphitrite]|uniref:importin-11-like isoform X1 n=2 Tax=Amphibalanus amphitrite TaxID=1232801 RepID=UPI001C90AA65|nr:importin-11-like isoform X1 [Amphibalanus amphitrite]
MFAKRTHSLRNRLWTNQHHAPARAMALEAELSAVLRALTAAASQSAAELKPAEAQLRQWETQPGFYTVLLRLAADQSVPVNVRWMAVLYFKNGVDLYWRKTARNCIPETERPEIRTRLLNCLNEPVNQVATQVAVLIARVARFDCPREWPELLPSLVTAARADEPLPSHRALLTLHHVVKTLASKRLTADRRVFQELTSALLPPLLAAWQQLHAAALAAPADARLHLERARLALKTLRRLTVHGCRRPHESADAQTLLTALFERCRQALELRRALADAGQSPTLAEKYAVLHTKVLADTLETHPISFVPLIQPTLEFCAVHVFTERGAGLLFERFTVGCLNLIKAILLCHEYRPPKDDGTPREPETLEAHRIKMAFFGSQPLEQMCRHLVTEFFPLTSDDLAAWDADPEGFVGEEGGEAWRFSLRPCTQCLFVALFRQFQAQLAPVLLDMLRRTLATPPSPELAQALAREAVYSAVGMAAWDLYDEVDFDGWLQSGLLQELTIREPNYRVVRRRVIWLIGRWVGVKLSASLRPQVYSAVTELLQHEEDLVVRLAAAQTLKDAVDDFEFCPETFMPFLPVCFGQLFRLLQEAHECDTKMQVLNVLSFVIDRLDSGIRPYCDELISYLPSLWNDSAAHNMLRVVILSTLIHLVQGLGPDSVRLYGLLTPVIALSTDLTSDAHVYLMEDGLALWQAAVENAPQMHPDFIELYGQLLPLFELGTETLQTAFGISQAYLLLSPEPFLARHGAALAAACRSLLPEMKPEGEVMVLRLVESALRAAPETAVRLFSPLLPFTVEAVHAGQAFPMVMSMHLSLLARLLLVAPTVLSQLLAAEAAERSCTEADVFNRLLEVWLDKMALVTPVERRKLLALALCSLLPAGSAPVTQHFNPLLLNVVETLHDVARPDDGADSLVVSGPEQLADDAEPEYETAHDARRRALTATDPVHRQSLKEVLQARLSELLASVGERRYQELVAEVDVETAQQLRQYVSL